MVARSARSTAHSILASLTVCASAALLAACASSTVAPSTVSIPAETAAPPAPLAAPDTVEALVWTLDEEAEGAPTTHWVRPEAAGFVERGATKSLLIAVDADVWRWSQKDVHLATEACEPNQTPPGEGNGVRATLERVGSTDHFEVVSPATGGGANEIKQDIAFEGSIGPYLFVREMVYTYSCGAHGGVGVTSETWDLKTRAKVSILSDAETKALDKAERVEAQKELPAFEAPLKLEDVAFKGAFPRYNERGALRFDAAFSTFACYACSSGSWGSYSASADIRIQQLPERARPYAKTPHAVASWIAAHPKAHIGGWSEVTPAATSALSGVITKAASTR